MVYKYNGSKTSRFTMVCKHKMFKTSRFTYVIEPSPTFHNTLEGYIYHKDTNQAVKFRFTYGGLDGSILKVVRKAKKVLKGACGEIYKLQDENFALKNTIRMCEEAVMDVQIDSDKVEEELREALCKILDVIQTYKENQEARDEGL